MFGFIFVYLFIFIVFVCLWVFSTSRYSLEVRVLYDRIIYRATKPIKCNRQILSDT